MPVYTFYNLNDYMLLFSVHCVLLSFPAMKRVVMKPMAANELTGPRVSCPAGDGQTGPQQADLSPPNLSSTLIFNPTSSVLPVSLHHKLTFLFFSLPLPLLYSPLSLCCPTPHPRYSPSYSKVIHVKIIDDEEYEKNKNFFLELAEPRMVDMSLQKGAVLNLFSLSFSL